MLKTTSEQAIGKEKLATKDAISYGALAFSLAFLALPLYMVLPNFYSKNLQLSLSVVGFILLMTRLIDALWDPLLGILIDRWYRQSPSLLIRNIGIAGVLICASFAVLLQPQLVAKWLGWGSLEFWIVFALLITYACYSFLSITYQSWAVLLGSGELLQSQVASVREAIALFGVLVASVLSNLYGLWLNWWVFTISLLLGLYSWYLLQTKHNAKLPTQHQAQNSQLQEWSWGLLHQQLITPFKDGVFKQLILVYAVNGIASAIAATLFLFFVQDKLQLSTQQSSMLLLLYFISAAISMPFWLNRIQVWGLKKSWLMAMLIAVIAFVGSYFLTAGDMFLFSLICAGTGFALGADLTAPNAMLNTHIQQSTQTIENKAQYLAWWHFVSKLNLALAAGLALPLLSLMSYTPQVASSLVPVTAQGLIALSIAYSVFPCLLKIVAMLLLVKNKQLK
jgi:GPH family glycoside/pentoside/hexuronide:cation symporter